MRKITGAIGLIGMLAGCAPAVWDKADGSQAGFNEDSARCRLMAENSGSSGFAVGSLAFVLVATLIHTAANAAREQGNYNNCMLASGYTPRQ